MILSYMGFSVFLFLEMGRIRFFVGLFNIYGFRFVGFVFEGFWILGFGFCLVGNTFLTMLINELIWLFGSEKERDYDCPFLWVSSKIVDLFASIWIGWRIVGEKKDETKERESGSK